MTLPRGIWDKVLECAQPPGASLPLYPTHWDGSWRRCALVAHNRFRAPGGECLKLAMLYREEPLQHHLADFRLLARWYWNYLCDYQEY